MTRGGSPSTSRPAGSNTLKSVALARATGAWTLHPLLMAEWTCTDASGTKAHIHSSLQVSEDSTSLVKWSLVKLSWLSCRPSEKGLSRRRGTEVGDGSTDRRCTAAAECRGAATWVAGGNCPESLGGWRPAPVGWQWGQPPGFREPKQTPLFVPCPASAPGPRSRSRSDAGTASHSNFGSFGC